MSPGGRAPGAGTRASPTGQGADAPGSGRGLQPWRRVVHVGSAAVCAAALDVGAPARGIVLAVLTGLLVVAVALDLARLRLPALNRRFFHLLRGLASPREERRPASSTWYLLGLLATAALFPAPVAASAALVMGLADPAASVVGRLWGRRRIRGGSLEGTLAFAAVAGLVLALRHPWPAAAAAALAATAGERLAWPVDDNLVVPLVTAAVLLLAGAG